jgi:chemotaxis protein methyltransferase CheR
MDIVLIKELIKKRSGLSFENQGETLLKCGVQKRMSEREVSSFAGYLHYLHDDEDEFCRLINLLTVNETYFYREPIHLAVLTNSIVPELISCRTLGQTIKIISAGCSTGEEPYSLAIALMEKYGSGMQALFSIMGADIDDEVLEKAREGIFGSLSFRSLGTALRDKYFEPFDNNQYRIKDLVREKIRFCKLNLMDSSYPAEFQGSDIIFYRNVAIYFGPETQKNIFGKLADLLNDRGYLFMSSTETYSHNIGLLSLVEKDGIFLYNKKLELAIEDRRKCQTTIDDNKRRPNASRKLSGNTPTGGYIVKKADSKWSAIDQRTAPARKNLSQRLNSSRRKDSPQQLFDEALLLSKDKRYSEALEKIDRILELDPAFKKAYMLKAGLLINMQEIGDAERICLKSIEIDQWCLEAYLLLGLIAKLRNDEELAVKRFKEALYIQSSCWLAHFYLGEMYVSRSDPQAACREYEIVIKLLQKGEITDHGLSYFPLSFPVDQVLHLCEHNIAKLKIRLEKEKTKGISYGI